MCRYNKHMLNRFAILLLGLVSFSCPAQQPEGEPVSRMGPQPAEKNSDEEGSHSPMLIAFTRRHCPPCELMEPWLAHLERRYLPHLKIIDVDIESRYGQILAEYFGVALVPSQLYINREGREDSRHQGVATLEMMDSAVRNIIGGREKAPVEQE